MDQVTLKISGKVQGVYFRSEIKEYADDLEIFGWARNNDDGSVEVVAQSEESDALKALIKWCGRGPSGATVEHIEQSWGQPTEPLVDFEIRY